ncbi:MAG: UDP-N-acetylmuramoyl-L-alanine--D-glutamate ligase [Alkaliphilus sp.]
MKLKNKRVLIIGLAVTGVPLVKVLKTLGAKIVVNDMKTKEQLKKSILELKDYNVEYILGRHPDNIDEIGHIDLAVISPGIPLEIPFIKKIVKKQIEIIGEIELAYRLTEASIIAITGTNGKTTTTALTGEMLKKSNLKTHIVGNIGVAAISKVIEAQAEDVMVMEVSSFQLESVVEFHPKISVLLNITPDHLDRHKTMLNYKNAKANIFSKQNCNDYAVINFDDSVVRDIGKKITAKKVFFSSRQQLNEGIYVDKGHIVIRFEKKERVIEIDKIKIPGNHNLENALAATAIAYIMGVETDVIKDTLETFEGVAHRLEFIDEVNGVRFINDSKGTNPCASIKAIEAVNSPIILIAGGMDKGSEFSEFIQAFDSKVKMMLVYGETAGKLYETALAEGFKKVLKVCDLEKAACIAFSNSIKGDTIMLSPACASWDMYTNFEKRGEHFKEIVLSIRGASIEEKKS